MTAVVAGEGLGLLNTSLSQLNGFGTAGQPKVGNGVDGLFVNVVNGNVVIQGQDDYVASNGFDVAALRIYNSLGQLDDDNGDNWSLAFHRRLINPPASGQADVTLVAADGHRTVFRYDAGRTAATGQDCWVSFDGAGAHDTLKRVAGQWIYEEPSTGVFDTYDSAGRLLTTGDRDGNKLTYAYTGNLLTSVTDASGQVTYLDYIGNKLDRIRVLSQGIQSIRVSYDYEPDTNRLHVVKVDLRTPAEQAANAAANIYTTTYHYDGASRRIASITQSDGASVQLEYVQVGNDYRVSKLTTAVGGGAAARVTTFNYDLAARRTDVLDALGGVTRYTYDDKNRLSLVEAPTVSGVRSVTSYAYDSGDNVAQVSTRVGSSETRSVRYQYSTDGNLTEVQDALGNTQRRAYNSANQLESETSYLTPDPDGAGSAQPSQPLVTRYVYDTEQHLRFLVTPEGRVTQYVYNAVGNQTAVIKYSGLAYTGSDFTDAGLSNWVSGLSDKSKAQRTDYTHDFRGQVSSATRFGTLDAAGAGVADATTSTTYFVYDAAGRLLKTIDPRGTAGAAKGQPYVTSFDYDGLGRVVISIDSNGQSTGTTYSSGGREVLTISPHGLRTTRTYNLAGELLEQTQVKTTEDAASRALASATTQYRYDDLGRLRMVTDPLGQRSYLLYDARGWKVADIGAEGSLTEYFYNDAGQITGVRRYAQPLALDAEQLAKLVDANGNPRETTLDVLLNRSPTGTNNIRPQVTGNSYVANVSTGTAVVAVDASTLTVTDGGDNGSNLYSATATIVNALNGTSELLSIASLPSGMKATYDASRNLLTLSDINNVARSMTDFQTALRSLRYQNTAATRIAGERHIQIVVNDGKDSSSVSTSRLTVVAVAPTVDLNGGSAGVGYSATYTEDAAAVAIVDALTLTVTDPDSASLTGGTVRITNLQNAGSETLSVTVGSTGISASYNSGTGVLSLSGSSSVANYQQVLRTLKYQNSSQAPTAGNRLVEVTVTDGTLTSTAVTSTVTVVAANDAPVISSATATVSYTEDDVPVVVVNAGLTLTDIDSTTLSSASISLGSRPDGALELLSVDVGSTGISASYNSSTGVLSLSGVKSVASYQQVLRTLKYQNDSDNPTAGSRTINLTVNDGALNSSAASSTVTVSAANDAPVITGASTAATYTEDTAAVIVVNAGLTVSDDDSADLTGATISLVSRPNGVTELLSVDVGSTGITASYNSSTGVLTLSGNKSKASYQQVLRTLKYQNTSQAPTAGNRSISLTVTDGTLTSTAVTSTVTVVAANDAPVISSATATVSYTEDDVPVVVVNAGLTLTDIDSTTLSSASISLGSRPDGALELLSVDVGSTGISASYNSSTGVLTLSGAKSVASYQQVLRTLKYQNDSDNPTAGSRTINLTVSDGALSSAVASSTVTVTPVNDAPVISSASTSATYTEDTAAVIVVNAGLTLTDIDSTNLSGATISLGSRPDGALELLSVDVGSTGITASYNSGTGVLTLSGSSSVANYQQVLRTLKYQNTSQAPTTGSRTINLTVSDGALTSSAASTAVSVTPVNDAPVISSATATVSYTEDGAAIVVVNAGLTLSDIDSANLSSASISLGSRPDGALELLSVDVGSTGISASYNSSTGVLTLSGAKSVASYQQVLRTLKYQNDSDNPTVGSRTISLTVNDGALSSSAASSTVTVSAMNDAPEITTAAASVAYTEDAGGVLVVDAGLTLVDVDNTNLSGATISLGSRPDGAAEVLSVTVGSTGISASYNSGTGVLTLSGSSSVANYQQVLRTLRYQNSSQNPTAGSRTINLTVTDGALASSAVSSTVTVSAVNDAPVVDLNGGSAGTGYSATYTEDTAAVAIVDALTLTVTDPDNASLTGGTVRITNLQNAGSETLSVTVGSTGITASYNSGTGVLTLSGSSSVANYQQVLRTLKYQNTSQAPTAGNRFVEVTVSDGALTSTAVTSTVTVVAVNDAPVISSATATVSYTEDDAPVVVVNAGLTLTDIDSTTLSSASISLGSRPDGALELLSVDVGSTGISASYNSSTGVLTLSGAKSVASYQQVLRTLKYQNDSDNPTAGSRTINLTVNDGALSSAVASSAVTVTPVNDAPVISSASTSATYTEDTAAVLVVNAGLSLTDVDSINLSSATITLGSRPDGTAEVLSVTVGSTGISASYNSGTGVLSLSGSSSVANYQQVLRTLKYQNTSQAPTAGPRTISLSAYDGALDSVPGTSTTVTVVAVNDAPVIANAEMIPTPEYVEDAGPTPIINAGLTLSDVDNSNLQRATISLLDPLDSLAELLSVDVGTTGISASYNSSTGVLTLTGNRSVGKYLQVLRTLKYQNTSQAPSAGTRTITVTVFDGALNSVAANARVTVVPVNDAPVIGNVPVTPTPEYVEDAAAILIADASLTLSDVDSPTLTGATVSLDSLPNGSAELLSVDVGSTGITASYSNGTLSLSGSQSVASYQQVLQTLRYRNTSQAPTAGLRTITVSVNDGADSSVPAISLSVTVTPVNDAPTISFASTPVTFTENGGPVLVKAGLSVGDVDSSSLTGAIITMASRPDDLAESLSVDVGSTGISASYNSSTGVLSLSGTKSVTSYQQVLRTLRYQNESENPTAGNRSISLTVSDGALSSAPKAATVTVVPVNDAPVIGNGSVSTSYTEDAAATVINNQLSLSDVDNTSFAGAEVRIVNLSDVGSEILAVTVGSTGISASYNGGTGVLTLSGNSSIANYQQVLRTLTYKHTSQNPTAGPRGIEVSVSDGTDSEMVQSTVNVIAVNDAPFTDLSASDPTTSATAVQFPLLGSSVLCAPDIALTDVDSLTLASATATLDSSNALESLSVVTTGTPIVATYLSTGVLRLSGVATIAQYRQVLSTLTYTYTPGGALFLLNKKIHVAVSDGKLLSNSATVTVLTPAIVVIGGLGDTVSIQSPNPPPPLAQTASTQSTSAAATFTGGPLLGNDRLEQRIYDASGRLVFTVVDDVDGSGTRVRYVTETKYDGASRVVKTVAYANALSTSVDLSEATIRSNLSVNSGADRVVQSLFDYDGLLCGMVDAEGGFTQYVYDAAGRQIRSTRYGKPVSYNGSQSFATLIAQATPTSGELSANPSLAPQNSYTLYDNKGQLQGQIDAEGYLTRFSYDKAGNKIQQVRYEKPLPANTSSINSFPLYDFSFGIDGTSETPDPNYFTVDQNGRLAVTVKNNGGGSDVYPSYTGNRSYTFADGVTFRNEVLLPAPTTGYVHIAIHGVSGSEGRRQALLINGTKVYAQRAVFSQGVGTTTETLLGDLKIGVSYVTEFVTNSSGITLYVYEKGKDRSSGYQNSVADSSWSSISRIVHALGSPSVSATSVLYIDNLAEMSNATADLIRAASGVNDRVQTWSYDSLNRVTQSRDEQGTLTSYNYNTQSGFLTSVTRASGQVNTLGQSEARTTSHRYDALGRLKETMGGVGSVVLAAAGTNTTNQDSVWSQYSTKNIYDLTGRLIQTTGPNSVDAAGNPVLHFTAYYYDAQSRLKYTVNAAGEVKGYTYNAFGEVAYATEYAQRIANPAGLSGGMASSLSVTADSKDRTIGKTYTLRGQDDVLTDALSYQVDNEYNAFGELIARRSDVDASHSLSTRRTDTWAYNLRGLLKSSARDTTAANAVNASETYVYDVFGRQTQRTDARGGIWSTGYDKLGRVVTTTDALNGGTVTAYDAFDRVLTRTDRLGNSTRYAYNELDRSLTVTTPEGIVTKTLSNRHGQQISITLSNLNGPETTTYEYDLDGRLTKVTKPATVNSQGVSNTESTTNEYDKAGLLNFVTDGRGVKTAYTYDAANRVLTRVLDSGPVGWWNLTTSYEYDAFGGAIRVKDANNIITETVFDLRGKSAAVIVDTAGLKLATAYTYDGQGNTLTVREGIQASGSSGTAHVPGTWNTDGAALRTTQYSFDRLGRRTQEKVDPAGLAVTTDYAYDKNGNLIRKVDPNRNTWRYVYDANNRQRFALDPEGGVKEVLYDLEGRPIKTIAYATPYAVGNLSGLDSALDPLATVQSGLVIRAEDQATITAYDGDGRAIYVVNALGEVVENRYDAAGKTVRSTRYGNRIDNNLLPLGANDDDVAAALSAVWSQNLNIGTTGLSYATNPSYISHENGGIALRSQYSSSATFPSIVGTRSYSLSEGAIGFRNELAIGSAAANRWVIDGAQNLVAYGASGFRRLSALISGSAVYANTVIDGVDTSILLGQIKENTTYIVETTVSATGATLYVYERGKARNSGFGYQQVTGWDNARSFSQTRGDPSFSATPATTRLDNFIEYRPGVPATSDSDQTTRYGYDAAGRLSRTTDARGYSESYDYDAVGNRVALTNKKGDTWTYAYDSLGRLVEERAPQESFYQLADSSSVGNPPLLAHKASRFEYDGLGNVLRKRDGWGSSATYSVADFTEQRITDYRYDQRGLQIRTIQAEVGAYNADADENASTPYVDRKESSAVRPESRTYFDGRGQAVVNRESVIEDGVQSGRYTYKLYDASGRVRYEVDAERYVTWYDYDGNGNVKEQRRYAAQLIESQTDSGGITLLAREGAVDGATAESSAERGKALDALNWIREKVGNLSTVGARSITTDYDLAGRKIRVKQPSISYYLADSGNRGTAQPITEYEYNGLGLLTEQRLARQANEWVTTYFGYDAAGRLRHQLDGLNYYARSDYDAFGRVVTRTEYALPQSPSMDAGGQPNFGSFVPTASPAALAGASGNDSRGYDRSTGYLYNQMDQVVEEKLLGVQYGQHTSGEVATQVGNVTVKAVVYDALGHAVATSDAAGAVTRTYYNKLGQVVATAEPARVTDAQTSAAPEGPQIRLLNLRNSQTVVVGSETDRDSVDDYYVQSGSGGQAYVTTTVTTRYYTGSIAWSSLTHLGDGPIRVTMQRQVGGSLTRELAGNATSTTFEWQAVSRKTGTTTSGTTSNNITGVTVEKQEIINGVAQWVAVLQQSGSSSYNGFRFEVSNIGTPSSATLQLKPSNGSYTNYALTPTGNSALRDLDASLAADTYSFKVVYSGTLSGTSAESSFVLARPAQNDPSLVQAGVGAEQTPLTELRYDLLGNQVAQIRYANGAMVASESGYSAGAPDASDQTSYQLYDKLGRVVETIDAEGRSEFRSYDLAGRERKVWRALTDVAGANRWQVALYEYDRVGRLKATVNLTQSPLSSAEARVTDRVSVAYNGFGEQTGKGLSDTSTETAAYDDGGRLWKTNTGGVLKAYEYDLQGNITAEVLLPSGTVLNSANDIQFAAGARRTEIVRDQLGRVTQKRDVAYKVAEHSASGMEAAKLYSEYDGRVNVTISSEQIRVWVPADNAYDTYTEYTAKLTWSNTVGTGSGDQTVNFSFTDGFGNTITRSATVAEAVTTRSFTWDEAEAGGTGTSTATVKKTVNGTATVVASTGGGSPYLKFATPKILNTSFNGVLEYRTAGSTGNYSTLTLTATAGDPSLYKVALSSLNGGANGTYDYRLTIQNTGNVILTNGVYEVYTGQFTVNNSVATAAAPLAITSMTPTVVQTLDRWGNVLTSTDPRSTNWVTSYRYDHANRAVMQTLPAAASVSDTGSSSTISPITYVYYDLRGQKIGERFDLSSAAPTAPGKLRRWFYDTAGQLVREQDAGNGVKQHIYDALGREVRSLMSNGVTVERGHDHLDRLLWQETQGYTNQPRRWDVYRYNELGDRISQALGALTYDNADSSGERTQYRYDTQGRLVQTIQPLGQTTTYGYDQYGNKNLETNPLGTNQNWLYDYFGRLQKYTDLTSFYTSYGYDEYGRLKTQTNSARTQTSLYGTAVTNTHGQNLEYTYYDNGWLQEVWDKSKDSRSQYEYDAAGHRTRERYLTGGGNVAEQESRLDYDAQGRLTRVKDRLYQIEYAYDLLGNRRRVYSQYKTSAGATTAVQDYWYAYDAENRIRISKGVLSGGQIKIGINQGVELSHNSAGNRTVEKKQTGASTYEYRSYSYDPSNRIASTFFSTIENDPARRESSRRIYDRWGRMEQYLDYGETSGSALAARKMGYDGSGRLLWQEQYSGSLTVGDRDVRLDYLVSGDSSYGYDAAGNLKGYRVTGYQSNGTSTSYTQNFKYEYLRFGGGYKESKVAGSGQASTGGFTPGAVASQYDVNGNLTNVSGALGANGSFGYRSLYGDQNGIVYRKLESSYTQTYVYANGNPIGTFGTDPNVLADFDYNYTPVSEQYPASTPGNYLVQRDGESLQQVAFALFGDAGLWYLIADANGLPGNVSLKAGQSLTIPNRVTNLKNSSETFKPYNLGEIVGSTTPELEYVPPPPPKKKCGFLQVLVIIVTVVVAAVITYYAGPEAGSAFYELGMAGAAALGAAAGSAAGQLTANAVGLQSGFSWSAVGRAAAIGGLTAGIASGIGIGAQGSAFGSFGETAGAVARAAALNVVGQGVNIALGQQEKFSWSSLAASAVTASFTGGKTGDSKLDQLPGIRGMSDGFMRDFSKSAASQLINRSTQVLLEGKGKIDFVSIAADSFGNALGNSIVGQIQDSQAKKLEAAKQAQEDRNAWRNIERLQPFDEAPLPMYVAPEIGELAELPTVMPDKRTAAGAASAATREARSINALNDQQASGGPSEYIRRADGSQSSSGLFNSEGDYDRQLQSMRNGFTDSLYLSGPVPVARYDLGPASLFVNGGLNVINSGVNASLNFLGAVTEPIDRYQGELISLEMGVGGPLLGGLAAEGTALIGATSRIIRGLAAVNTALPNAAPEALSVYRKMSAAEAATTLETKSLQPPISGTNSSKYLSESLSKVEAFQNKGVPVSTREEVLEFVVERDGYNDLMQSAVNQAGSKGVDAIKINFEGISNSNLRNIGIPASQLDAFNKLILQINKLSGP